MNIPAPEHQDPILPHDIATTNIVETNGTAEIKGQAIRLSFSDDELDEPSLTSSDTSFSSIDDFSPWRDAEAVTTHRLPVRPEPRQVTFHPHVEVREYSLTISEHPFCDDPYPVSLDWAYAGPYRRHINNSKTRGMVYTPGRRICVEAKRRRLAEVRGCSETDIDEMIRSPYELFPLGWLIVTIISKLLAAMTFRSLERGKIVEEDDEYRLLYTGATTKRPVPVLIEQDLEAGLYF